MSTCENNDNAGVSDANEEKLSNRARKRLKRIRKEKDTRKALQQSKKQKVADGTLVTKPLDSITDEILAETSYYFENGLRKVYPYYFTFTTFSKGRWYGKSIKDIFSSEFTRNKAVFTMAMDNGCIKVNNVIVKEDYKMKNGDFLANRSHRHEMPITEEKIKILADDDDVLVIDKPSSIPVHPCGRYRHNSTTIILAKEHGYRNLRVTYRLDRLTSGLLVFAKNASTAIRIQDAIKNREVHKEYLCRVAGNFPDESVTCDEALGSLLHSLGIFKVMESGKPASTLFLKLFYDSKTDTSVVKCLPHTGRTHQIRVHLQYLGFPIINDPVYNSEAWGPSRGKGGIYSKTEEELIASLIDQNNNSYEMIADNVTRDYFNQYYFSNTDPKIENTSLLVEKDELINSDCTFNSEEMSFDEACADCLVIYEDPKPSDLIMFLHAHKYKSSKWEYMTDVPFWAKEDWIPKENKNTIDL